MRGSRLLSSQHNIKMETLLRNRILFKTLVATISLLILGAYNSFAQYPIDGDYSEEEYSTGQVIVLDPNASGTCEVGQIYAVVKDSVLLIGIRNGNAGNAIFRYYFDTQPDYGTNFEEFNGDSIYVSGADKVLQIQANDGSTLQVYDWNGSSWDSGADGITAMVGDYNPNDKEFIEILVPLGSNSFYDLCDLASNGEIHLVTYISFSGGNIRSNTCFSEVVGFTINLNGEVSPPIQEYCASEVTETDFTLSGEWGKILGWQSSTDGINWSVYLPNSEDATTYTAPADINQTTYYRATIQSTVCDEVTLESAIGTITIIDTASETISVSGCDTVVVNDTFYTESGIYTQHLTNAAGCDSTLTIQVNVSSSVTSVENITACDSYDWNGTTYTTGGTYTFNTLNAAGCDSTATLNLVINNSDVTESSVIACDSFTWDGTTYFASGDYVKTYTNTAACDSTHTLHLTINNSTSSVENITACDSYDWNGTTYTTGGTYTFNTLNAAGCDSTATLNLVINNSDVTESSVIACDSFTWDGTTYFASGDYVKTYSNAAACDSTHTLHLTINNSTSSVENITACDSYTWNGTTYTTGGSYTFNTVNAEGCDSTATLNLVINNSDVTESSVTACDSFTWDGTTYFASGDYVKTYSNTAACDSTHTLHLTINNSTTSVENITACDSYTWNGTTYTTGGTYTFNTVNAEGCDSTATLNLVINKATEELIERTVCDQLTINNITYTESGTYTQNLTNAAGCDSTLTIVLNVNESSEQTIRRTACESYELNGVVYTQSGTYTQNLTTESGCALTITLILTINQSTDETIEVEGCGSVTVNGITYSNSGTYIQNLTNAAGCDSTLTIIASISEGSEETIEVSNCNAVTVNGIEYTTSGTYTQNLVNAAGCDSTLTIIANILESTQETINATVCSEFTINNETFTESGIYVQQLTNAAGCDSTLTINLLVEDNIPPVANCNDLTAQLDANGSFTLTAEDINNGSSDNCEIDTMFIDKSEFSCGDIGANEVTLTVIDVAGNETTCTSIVIIEKGEAFCGEPRLLARPDSITFVECPGNQVIWVPNLLDNDDVNGASNISITVTQLPTGVELNKETGQLNFFTDDIQDLTLEFNYTICSETDETNCSSGTVKIVLLLDTDCDGIANITDIDDDDDGLLDIHEIDPNKSAADEADIDTDGDGIVDRLDLDSDGDGIMDNVEWQQTIAEAIDHADYVGLDYFEPLGSDSDGDGWDDRYDDNEENIYYLAFDADEDGTPDYLDLDTDGDDVEDIIEGNDANFDGVADITPSGMDSDHDGLDDAFDTYDTWFVKKDKYKNTISSNAALQDEDTNGKRDWREEPEEQETEVQGEELEPSDCVLIIPDGFSPNGDNINDYFTIEFDCAVGAPLFEEVYPDAKIEIFNRWGNLVYDKERFGNTSEWGMYEAWWDGTSTNSMQIGSDKLPNATYFFIINLNDGSEPVTGSVYLND